MELESLSFNLFINNLCGKLSLKTLIIRTPKALLAAFPHNGPIYYTVLVFI